MAIRLLSSESIDGALTLTGNLTGTTATFAGIITANSSVSGDYVRIYGASGTGQWDIYGNGANLRISDNQGAGILAVDRGATFGGTIKIGSGSLTNPSTNADDIVIDNGAGVETGMTFASSVASSIRFGQFVNNSIGSIEYIHTGNHLRFITNGTERVRITGVGNVGIGISPPADHKLQIHNPGESYARFALTNSNTGSASADGLIFQMETLNSIIKNQEAGYLTFGTSGRETDLHIDSSGNVGIGAESPVGKLQVSLPAYTNEDTNSQQAIFGVDSGYGVRIGYNETDNKGYINVLKPGVAWGSLILQEDVGKVGIGETNPAHKLSIKATDDTRGILVNNTLTTSYAEVALKASREFRMGTGNSASATDARDRWYVYDATAGTHRLTLDSLGNFGIGTTSPQTKLEVNGGLVKIVENSNTAFYGGDYVRVFGTQSYGFRNSSGSAIAQISLTGNSYFNGGNVGIGTTSPQANLHINEDTSNSYGKLRLEGANRGGIIEMYNQTSYPVSSWTTDQSGNIFFATSGAFAATSLSTKFTILTGGNVGIGTTNPSSELEVAGRAIVEKLEVARYSDSNAPAAVYVGRSANPMGQGGIFRLGAIESSSTVNKIDEPFLITYSSGHWGCQPMFFAEFTITYYRGSYIKYWAQHEVSGSRLEIVDGPYGGQIITGGAPVSRTITQLCTNCHGGQPVYKCVWKWSNSGTYIKTSPIVSLVDGHGSARVYTSGSSSESAIDTLLGSAGSPGPAYLLMGIDNAQAAGFTGLQTQN